MTVLMPVYNAEPFLEAAIDSILEQDFEDFEFLIINDGSSDESGAMIDAKAAEDPRIRVVHQENKGLVDMLNLGVELARAALIARMDADDLALPARLSAQVDAMARKPSLAVLGSHVEIIDERGEPLGIGYYPTGDKALAEFIDRGCPLAHPAVMMRTEVVRDAGGYRRSFAHAEDYDLWFRLFELGHGIDNIPRPLLRYRQNSKGVSSRHRRQQALVALVARLSHRMRRDGLDDPVAGDKPVDDETLAHIPAEFLDGFEIELFELLHGGVSLQSPEEIRQAISDFRSVPVGSHEHDLAARFLLRAANGFWRHGCYWECFLCCCRAAALSPMTVVRIMRGRVARRGEEGGGMRL